MRVGEAARRLGVGVQTLHFYEREGLIPAPGRSAAGYRLYSPALVERVAFIRKAQALGLPLTEIRDVLALAERGASPCQRVHTALVQRLAEVDARLRELTTFRDELAVVVVRSASTCQAADGARLCTIVEEAPSPPTAARSIGALRRRRAPPRR